MRLLVAVSNEPLAHAIHGALLAGRHEVSLASTGSIALAAVAKESFDAVILDESLFGISTEQLIESLRNARASVKILLLTSTPLSKTIGEGSRWRALPDEYAPIEETPYSSFSANSRANNSDAEAEQRSDNAASSAQANVRRPDAALSKPFSDGELLSYVGSLATDSPAMIIRGNLTLDTTNHKAYYASTHSAISLSRLEYSLLEALVKADGQFVNTSELVKLIGGPFFEQQGLLKNALYTLDKKLTRAGLIMTQRGSNYRHSIAGLNQYSRMPWGTGVKPDWWRMRAKG